jgi:hypothetical protein
MLGRGTGDHGELECVVDFLDCFQMREGEVAGAAMGGGTSSVEDVHFE